jgi:hypothetical protein
MSDPVIDLLVAHGYKYNPEAGSWSKEGEKPALPPMHTSGLVAIKTLLSRDPCAHAKVAIEMIDAMLAAEPKPWVGLTDEERNECTQSPFTADQHRAIEAKLKEKNHV